MTCGMREVLAPRTALDGAPRAIPAMPRTMEAVTARGIMRGTARRMTQAGGSRTVPGVARRMEPVTARRMVRVMAPGRGKDSAGMEPGTIQAMVRRMARGMDRRADRDPGSPGRDSRMDRILGVECRPTGRRVMVPMGRDRTEGIMEGFLLLSS